MNLDTFGYSYKTEVHNVGELEDTEFINPWGGTDAKQRQE